jgi:predicted trehalose synthase
MSAPPPPHSELAALCDRALGHVSDLPSLPLEERGARVAELRADLAEIGSRAAELHLRDASFPDEQALLGDAVAALLAIDMDRAGPRVERYVERISENLRRIAGT